MLLTTGHRSVTGTDIQLLKPRARDLARSILQEEAVAKDLGTKLNGVQRLQDDYARDENVWGDKVSLIQCYSQIS